MNKEITEKKNKGNYFLYALVLFCALFLSVTVKNELQFSPFLIRFVSVLATFFLFFYGFKQPNFPFYILILYLPFAQTLQGNFLPVLNLTNILTGITVICWVLNSISKNKKLIEHVNLNWFILLFFVQCAISVTQVNFYGNQSSFIGFIVQLKRWLTPIALYFIAMNMVTTKKELKKVIVIIMLVVFAVGIITSIGGVDLNTERSFSKIRVGSIAGQPNSMAAFFVYYMFLFLGFFFVYFPAISSWFMLIPFIFCLKGIEVTFSRGGYVAAAFGIMATTFFKNKVLTVFLCFGIIMLVLMPQFLPLSIQNAINRTIESKNSYGANFEEVIDKSSSSRLVIWRGALEMIMDDPIFGVGYGEFATNLPRYVPEMGPKDAHNTYLLIAAEMGIPALIVFMCIWGIVFIKSFWLYKKTEDKFFKAFALGMLGGIMGMLATNMFGSRLNASGITSYYWILSGIVMRSCLLKKKGEIQ